MTPPELHSFSDRVYWLVGEVPLGQVAAYGQIAVLAGHAGAARAVGTLMRKMSENGLELPWHRIVNSRAGISCRGDLERPRLQRELLEAEGHVFSRQGTLVGAACFWKPEREFWENEDPS